MEEQTRRHVERRGDRRKHSRSGRRSNDPHVSAWHWRRVAFLFAGYVAYLSLRSLPVTVGNWIRRRR